ncbi:MAG: hypothetical protein PHE83_19315, partial [Opitutaceae bacterium]|nr:hypothetical protein [Opitutaceae bacterium]
DNKPPRLVVCGKFTTIDGLAGTPNVASYDMVADEWLACASGVTLAALTSCYSVASFNARLWLARGYSPLDDQPTGESLWVLANGPGQVWRGASAFVKDLDLGGGGSDDGSAFWGYKWDGTTSEPGSSAINDVCVYGNRLMVGGTQQFRTLRRGRKFCGPVVGYDTTEKLYQGLREFLRGEVYALLPFDGGLAVGGDFEVRLTDGRVLRNVAVWYEPVTWGDDGTWDELGGGTDGPVRALASYGGYLHAGGKFDTAGGVAAKGLARWTGSTWNYTANFSDYGTVLALCVAGDDLIVGGDFQKADGQSRFGAMCVWTGTALAEVYAKITAADALPFVRALCYYDGYLYAGGWFDLLDITTIYSVGRRQYPGAHAWEAMPNSGGSPPNGIATPGTVWSLCSHASKIYVGTEPGSMPNGEANASGLWTWNPASPDWARAFSFLSWGNQPVTGLYSDGTYIYFGAEAVINSPGWIEAYGPKHRIFRQTSPTGTPTTIGADGDGPYFEHAVMAVCYCNAGQADRLYVGGKFRTVGKIMSATSRPCNLITSIGTDDRIHDVRGGLGVAGYYAQFTSPQWLQRMRVIVSNDLECERLAIVGNFGTMNDAGSQHLCGIDLRGRMVGIGGGLAGTNRYDSPGAQDGVTDIKAIPRTEWPAYWETLFTARAEEPYLPFLYLIGGSFSVAVNEDIPPADQEDIPETVQTPGIIAHYGDYLRAVLPETSGLPQYCTSVSVYDGDLVHLGLTTPPMWWDGDETAGDWTYYVEPETAGALTMGEGRHLIVWQGMLYVAGYLLLYPDVDPSDDIAAVAEWDGADFTLDMIAGLGADDAGKYGNSFLVADLDDTLGECLFLAAQPADPSTQCPVYRKTIGGSWAAV